ncbi:hypothetical protein CHARACLAT_032728 [Characodon lateralis]|uniref:Uncharacterized protein n=1 Tax=Characodon lateralis TaxID=208331 RepID=A0ABU7EFI4_9TELE|nr:hypothetical protein [Characodon lateralis]
MQNFSVGLRLRSSDSSVASFSVLSCSLVFCEETTPFLSLVFILQIASLLISCCRASFPIIEWSRGHRDFSVLSPSLSRQSCKQPAAGSLYYDFCLFFGLQTDEKQRAPGFSFLARMLVMT